MRCRYCHGTESKVVDSRPTDDGTSIRRRRECMSCGRRFTTYEKIEEIPIMVVKKDGRRETFDSEKILMGVRKACENKRGLINGITVNNVRHAGLGPDLDNEEASIFGRSIDLMVTSKRDR